MNADAKRTIVAAVVLTGVVTALGEFTKNQAPKPRLAIAGAVVGVGLAGLAEVTPELARAMSLLLLATAVFLDGGDAFRSLARLATQNGPGQPAGNIATDPAGGGDFTTATAPPVAAAPAAGAFTDFPNLKKGSPS